MARLLMFVALVVLCVTSTSAGAVSIESRPKNIINSQIDIALPIIPSGKASTIEAGHGSFAATTLAHKRLEEELYRRSDPLTMSGSESHMTVEDVANLMGVVDITTASDFATRVSHLLAAKVGLPANNDDSDEGIHWHVRPSAFRDYLLISLESAKGSLTIDNGIYSPLVRKALRVLSHNEAGTTEEALAKRREKVIAGRIPIDVLHTSDASSDYDFYGRVLWLPRRHVASKDSSILQKQRRTNKLRGNFPGANQDPLTLASRYKVPLNTPLVGDPTTNTQAVAEFEGEQFYQTDVNGFAQQYNLTFPEAVQVVGPNNGGYFDEGIMDLEYIQGLAPQVVTYWVAKNEFDLLGMSEELVAITPVASRPTVLSISWGSGESGYDAQQMTTDSAEFTKLGLLGITILSAAGDQGTGSTGLFSCGTFDPTWPGTSPHVTTVGATYANQNTNPSSSDYEEIAWGDSGGGFSSTFGLASYQAKAVLAYIKSQQQGSNSSMPPSQYYNITGRAFPDVAVLGTNFAVYSNQYWGYESGTSAATPSFAAMITRINHLRAQQSKKSVGFLNPTLYAIGAKHGSIGFDVTQGSNPCPPCTQGFNAAKGWDPVSGWGTPDYTFLEPLLMALP